MQSGTGAGRADSWSRLGKIAVMALQGAVTPVIRQGDTTMDALRYCPAITALQVGGKAAPIDQNEALFLPLQTGRNGLIQGRGDDSLIGCRVRALVDHGDAG